MRTPVERGVDGAEFGAGEEEIEMFVPVTGEDGNTITFFNALRFQPVGKFIGAAIRVTEGQLSLGRFARVDECKFVRRIKFAPCKIITDIHIHSLQIRVPKDLATEGTEHTQILFFVCWYEKSRCSSVYSFCAQPSVPESAYAKH